MPEVVRRLESVERRFNDYTRKEVYERDMGEIRTDISEIKESQKWAMRLIAGQFVALIVALLVFVIQRLPT